MIMGAFFSDSVNHCTEVLVWKDGYKIEVVHGIKNTKNISIYKIPEYLLIRFSFSNGYL
jgi:hypothetical protein